MSALEPRNHSLTRRVERALRWQRLRTLLMIVGVALVITGVFIATVPFGPPVSSAVAIPKADIYAGLWLVQALPSATIRHIGLVLASGGVVMLLLQFLLRARPTRDDDNPKL
jgi:hypothetical protein